MKQVYSNYTSEDQAVWNTLFNRQKELLNTTSCIEYLDSVNVMKSVFNEISIPNYSEMNSFLTDLTGWEIHVVPGLIPVEDFFELLANRKFSASTWIRKMHQLDYLEEPDMFHDIFGHTPLLSNSKFAKFMEDFGKLGMQFVENKEIVLQLQRLYWFTIEFGLIKQGETKVYGAGICSSFGETNHCLSKEVTVKPFSMQEVITTDFKTDEVQTLYFELESFDQLFEEFEKFKQKLTS